MLFAWIFLISLWGMSFVSQKIPTVNSEFLTIRSHLKALLLSGTKSLTQSRLGVVSESDKQPTFSLLHHIPSREKGKGALKMMRPFQLVYWATGYHSKHSNSNTRVKRINNIIPSKVQTVDDMEAAPKLRQRRSIKESKDLRRKRVSEIKHNYENKKTIPAQIYKYSNNSFKSIEKTVMTSFHHMGNQTRNERRKRRVMLRDLNFTSTVLKGKNCSQLL